MNREQSTITPWLQSVLDQVAEAPTGIAAIIERSSRTYHSAARALQILRDLNLVVCLMRGQHTVWVLKERAAGLMREIEKHPESAHREHRRKLYAKRTETKTAQERQRDEGGTFTHRSVSEWEKPRGGMVASVFDLGRD